MSELLLPSPDSSQNRFLETTAILDAFFNLTIDIPFDIYDGYFIDGDKEIRVTVDTIRPHEEDGELCCDSSHEVTVSELTINGMRRKIPSPDAGRYPFTKRSRIGSTYAKLLYATNADAVILQGPNWREGDE